MLLINTYFNSKNIELMFSQKINYKLNNFKSENKVHVPLVVLL